MGWIYLVLAGACEIVYAAAMPRTDGFTKLGPGAFCAVFISMSMYLLSLSTRTTPVGTAYRHQDVGLSALPSDVVTL